MRGLLFLADRTEVLRQVRAGLGATATVVVSDAVANLVGAVGAVRPAAVVAAGTGAVAFGSDFDAVWHRVDGWGHLLGDVGSGAWIGLEGLRAALRADDGLTEGSPTLLAEGVKRFGPTATWPRQLMAAPDAPERLASFAPVVTAAAEEGDAHDAVAAEVCARAGRGLAQALLAAASGLREPTLVATGGVVGAPPVRAALDTALADSGQALTAARGGALDGALVLGHALSRDGHLPEHPAYLVVATG
jgi:N-acetylglucosamine kinase-like BadF-type ATPase